MNKNLQHRLIAFGLAAVVLSGVLGVYLYWFTPEFNANSLVKTINEHPQRPDETEAEYVAAQPMRTREISLRPFELLQFDGRRDRLVVNESGFLYMARYDPEQGVLTIAINPAKVPVGVSHSTIEPYAVYLTDYGAKGQLQAQLKMAPPAFRGFADGAHWRLHYRYDNLRRHSTEGRYGENRTYSAPVRFEAFELVAKDGTVVFTAKPER
ncbi:MAG: hypothetical protein EKK53_19435 [Burkholderiales bacterium]|nr:MAG: hypothetical protein EKK53_19435 [Burkholderiales bacterium]